MVGSVYIDVKNDLVANLFDGYIFQKTANGWEKFTGTFYRSFNEPETAIKNDIWLSDTNNQLYLYSGSAWAVTNRMLYFTEEMLTPDDGNVNDYNVLSGIIQVGPIVKFGSAELFDIKDGEYGFPYVNPTDKKIYVRTDKGDYRLNYANEQPNKSLSLTTALSINNDLYDGLDFRKTVGS